ncbi:MAG TPA: FHA domain-containing protein [Acidobacteriota bacterium]|nr:FHA domain-containing protein [Acidobacteriota bacterium]
MSARLFCKAGPLAGRECQIEKETTIGSHPDSGLVLEESSIAERHARIRYDGDLGCYVLERLCQEGLALDGEAVLEREPLQRLHVITLGEHDFFFQSSGPAPAEAQAAPSQQPAVAPDSRERPGEKTLLRKIRDVLSPPSFESAESSSSSSPPSSTDEEVLTTQPMEAERPGEKTSAGLSRGPGTPPVFEAAEKQEGDRDEPSPPAPEPADESQQEEPAGGSPGELFLELDTLQGLQVFPLREGENDLGRSKKCRVSVRDGTISRRHAVLKVESGRVKVSDLGSMNKSYVDERVIEEETEVAPDVPLRFGRLKGRVRLKKT